MLPLLLILMSLSFIYVRFVSTPALAGILFCDKPAMMVIVLFAAYRIGSHAFKSKVLWAIAFASFLTIVVFSMPFPLIIASAVLVDYLGNQYLPSLFSSAGGHQSVDKGYDKALIDDVTPTFTHTHFSWRGLAQFLLLSMVL